jgi:hypothetical protein
MRSETSSPDISLILLIAQGHSAGHLDDYEPARAERPQPNNTSGNNQVDVLELAGAERQQLSNTSEDNHVDSNAQDLFLNAQ